MERKLFGHRAKKHVNTERTPGKPYTGLDSQLGKSQDAPSKYEGKEHVKYKNPGFTRHKTSEPGNEPKMKSRVSKEEMHEMEDNYHMGVPDQTEDSLPAKIKRARMKMDAPDQEDPDRLRGNMVDDVGYEGDKDTSGEEEEGPNYMQSNIKENKKKAIIAIARKKMQKKKSM